MKQPKFHHKNHEDTIGEFIEEEESKFIRFLKKAGILVMGVILIGLIISLSIPPDSLASLIESETAEKDGRQYHINLDNGEKIMFDSKVYDAMLSAYLQGQQKEIKICLIGEKKDSNYYIVNLYLPEIHSHSFNQVRADLCSKETIIDLHTHPYRSCIFSDVDVGALKTVKEINPDTFMGLMCERDRFNFMGYDK